MPVKTVFRAGKYRVVEAATGNIAKRPGGGAADGGGKDKKALADRMAKAINASKNK